MSMRHELKTWPKYFQAIYDGEKTFEYRKNDRGFKKGDSLLLKEFNPETQEYTGRVIVADITYVLENQMGVMDGYAILSITVKHLY
jgi:hypothetical protein